MQAFFLQVWKKIKFLGAAPEEIGNLRITLLKQILQIALLVSVLDFTIGLFLGNPIYYQIVTFSLIVSVFGLIRLNEKGYFHNIKYLVLIAPPLIILFTMILYGGKFGEEYLIAVNILFAWFLIENAPKTKLLLYAIVLFSYLLGIAYLQNYEPLYPKVDNVYDDILTLLTCIYFILKIVGSYQTEVELHQSKQQDLIKELQVKNKTLEETTQELQQFTYVASHDLKTPIRTIVSFIDLIEYDIKKERYNDLLPKLDFARNGAKQMSTLLEDISTYSKFNFKEKRAPEKVHLNDVLDKVRLNLHALVQEKNAIILHTDLPIIWGLESSLIVVFQNLIENGIKYNECATPTISIEVEIMDKNLAIHFTDNGIGIEQQYNERIFHFFKRLHNFDDYQGSGVGLGICKKIINSMDGTVTVMSQINEGSRFTIVLPKEIFISLPENKSFAENEQVKKIGFA